MTHTPELPPTMIDSLLASPTLAEIGTLIETTAGYRNDYGEFIEGSETQTDIQIITVPLSGEERAILPEALRLLETRKFFIRGHVVAVGDDTPGAIIEYDAVRYRAATVEHFRNFNFSAVVGTAPVTS